MKVEEGCFDREHRSHEVHKHKKKKKRKEKGGSTHLGSFGTVPAEKESRMTLRKRERDDRLDSFAGKCLQADPIFELHLSSESDIVEDSKATDSSKPTEKETKKEKIATGKLELICEENEHSCSYVKKKSKKKRKHYFTDDRIFQPSIDGGIIPSQENFDINIEDSVDLSQIQDCFVAIDPNEIQLMRVYQKSKKQKKAKKTKREVCEDTELNKNEIEDPNEMQLMSVCQKSKEKKKAKKHKRKSQKDLEFNRNENAVNDIKVEECEETVEFISDKDEVVQISKHKKKRRKEAKDKEGRIFNKTDALKKVSLIGSGETNMKLNGVDATSVVSSIKTEESENFMIHKHKKKKKKKRLRDLGEGEIPQIGISADYEIARAPDNLNEIGGEQIIKSESSGNCNKHKHKKKKKQREVSNLIISSADQILEDEKANEEVPEPIFPNNIISLPGGAYYTINDDEVGRKKKKKRKSSSEVNELDSTLSSDNKRKRDENYAAETDNCDILLDNKRKKKKKHKEKKRKRTIKEEADREAGLPNEKVVVDQIGADLSVMSKGWEDAVEPNREEARMKVHSKSKKKKKKHKNDEKEIRHAANNKDTWFDTTKLTQGQLTEKQGKMQQPGLIPEHVRENNDDQTNFTFPDVHDADDVSISSESDLQDYIEASIKETINSINGNSHLGTSRNAVHVDKEGFANMKDGSGPEQLARLQANEEEVSGHLSKANGPLIIDDDDDSNSLHDKLLTGSVSTKERGCTNSKMSSGKAPENRPTDKASSTTSSFQAGQQEDSIGKKSTKKSAINSQQSKPAEKESPTTNLIDAGQGKDSVSNKSRKKSSTRSHQNKAVDKEISTTSSLHAGQKKDSVSKKSLKESSPQENIDESGTNDMPIRSEERQANNKEVSPVTKDNRIKVLKTVEDQRLKKANKGGRIVVKDAVRQNSFDAGKRTKDGHTNIRDSESLRSENPGINNAMPNQPKDFGVNNEEQTQDANRGNTCVVKDSKVVLDMAALMSSDSDSGLEELLEEQRMKRDTDPDEKVPEFSFIKNAKHRRRLVVGQNKSLRARENTVLANSHLYLTRDKLDDKSNHSVKFDENARPSKRKLGSKVDAANFKSNDRKRAKTVGSKQRGIDHELRLKWALDPEDLAQLKNEGIQFETGVWMKNEVEILEENIKEAGKSLKMPVAEVKKLLVDRGSEAIKRRAELGVYPILARGLNRPMRSVFEKVRTSINPDNYKGGWTFQEEKRVLELYRKYGNQWLKIGEEMGRSQTSVSHKVRRILGGDVRKGIDKMTQISSFGPWKRDEEERLLKALKDLTKITKNKDQGKKEKKKIPWDPVAVQVKTRNAEQCRVKWEYDLCWKKPGEVSKRWTGNDFAKLLTLVSECGETHEKNVDWMKITKELGKPESAVVVKKKWLNMKRSIPGFKLLDFKEHNKWLMKNKVPRMLAGKTVEI